MPAISGTNITIWWRTARRSRRFISSGTGGEYLAVYPVNNREEDLPMSQQLSREELTELVKAIQTVRDPETGRTLAEAEHTALVVKFAKGIPPGGSDLIYYPQLVEGFPGDREPTVEEIVDMALREI